MNSAWGLTSMCRSSVLEITTFVVPLHVIGLHALSFIKWCLGSESDVQYVTYCGLQHGCIARMSSIHGKNIQLCSAVNDSCRIRIDSGRTRMICMETFDKIHIYATCLNRKDTESYCHAPCSSNCL